jgi:hypothetical protein
MVKEWSRRTSRQHFLIMDRKGWSDVKLARPIKDCAARSCSLYFWQKGFDPELLIQPNLMEPCNYEPPGKNVTVSKMPLIRVCCV